MFERDSFVKWTGKDESGSYSYTGQVKMMHGDTVIFEDNEGLVYGVHKDDGMFQEVKKPKGWNRPKSVMGTPFTPKKEKKRKKADGPTKKEQALILVRDTWGKGHGKDVAIQRIIDVLGMSKAGATTYFYAAKKQLGG